MKKLSLLFIMIFSGLSLMGQQSIQDQVEMADLMRSNGKIYVVVAVLVIILTGLFAYLISLDRKITKLENRLADKDK